MIETERKFLVKGDFLSGAVASRRITQGYLCADSGRSVRVRISGEKAYITIKGPSDAKMWSRYEFEQAIPLNDAEALMRLCLPGLVDKVRYNVPFAGYTWEVDVFHGENEGLVVAEIELPSEETDFELPPWAGKEVTLDKRYYNSMLARQPYKSW
ncbi:MAG: CYTH domain-containing protein [Tannerella sp.]|jgi:CYTH domain-containing protein|nr:CYTH domain-containing protein [Tannerella sp.]